jgi:hypothetical protein
MLKNLLITTTFLALALFSIKTVSAHGLVQSFTKEVDIYRIEFEYDFPDIIDGEINSLIFRLLDKSTGAPIIFDSLLARVEKKSDKSTYLVARLAADQLQDGVARLTTTFPQEDYLLTLGFTIKEKKVAEVSFDFTSKPGEKKFIFPTIPVISFLVGLGLAFLITKIIYKKKINHYDE